MIKKHQLLAYDKYIIYQDDNLYKFNLDSLLLAYFTETKLTTKTIIDIGAGAGAISLYLTLKTKANIKAVEIQKPLFELLKRSVKINNLNKQITAVNKNVLNLKEFNIYDIAVCNPPYFKVSKASNLSENESLNIAKHELKLTLQQLVEKSFYLLKDKGSLNIIHRPERLIELLDLFKNNNFEVKRLAFVYPKKGDQASNILIEAVKGGNPNSLKILSPLYIYDENGSFTEDSLKIFNFGRKI